MQRQRKYIRSNLIWVVYYEQEEIYSIKKSVNIFVQKMKSVKWIRGKFLLKFWHITHYKLGTDICRSKQGEKYAGIALASWPL